MRLWPSRQRKVRILLHAYENAREEKEAHYDLRPGDTLNITGNVDGRTLMTVYCSDGGQLASVELDIVMGGFIVAPSEHLDEILVKHRKVADRLRAKFKIGTTRKYSLP